MIKRKYIFINELQLTNYEKIAKSDSDAHLFRSGDNGKGR